MTTEKEFKHKFFRINQQSLSALSDETESSMEMYF